MFAATPEAQNHAKKARPIWRAKDHTVFYENARKARRERGGNVEDRLALHGLFEIQFGKYAGQSFHWTLENDLGYSAAMAYSFGNDVVTDTPLSRNKSSFRKYVLSFPQGVEAVEVKAKEKTADSRPQRSSLSSMMVGSQHHVSKKVMEAKLLRVTQKATPNLQGKKLSSYSSKYILVSDFPC